MHFACGCARINGNAKVENPCFLYNGKASGPSSARARRSRTYLYRRLSTAGARADARARARFVLEDF